MARGRSQAGNNARSNSMNPNNGAHRASANNRANQMNPNNPAHPAAPVAAPAPASTNSQPSEAKTGK
jgi:hypothetical protein